MVSNPLPRIRLDLDFMPSPLEDRPGLLIRDPYGFSEATMIVPPQLVECLRYFDGEKTELDLREALVRMTSDLQVGELQSKLTEALDESGFLMNERFLEMRDEAMRTFAESEERYPAHAGSAYPEERGELHSLMSLYLGEGPRAQASEETIAIAAPHVSPEGGWECYREAYLHLPQSAVGRTFVVLGTSHYGEPDKFGLTHKPYDTPFGRPRTAPDLVKELSTRAAGAVKMEDYCHSFEHSIEFQVVFLQALYGPDIEVLPILCGSFFRSIQQRKLPESDDTVHAFLDSLGEIAQREKDRLIWVMGVDMAHIGKRYGDPIAAEADQGYMEEVRKRDEFRMERMIQGDPEGFWNLVSEHGDDDLKWCGSSPIYTFLNVMRGCRGSLLQYQQWNIDEESVVTFAGLKYQR